MTFWSGKRVLLTGHTGFKGAWAGRWLAKLGADVTGLALAPEQCKNLFSMLGEDHLVASHIADLRNASLTAEIVAQSQPEFVFHMAAQSLVRFSYANPVQTFDSNVMGTVHLLDALRHQATLKAIVIVTSDKVYENQGLGFTFKEGDILGGHDPYSASKAATELVVSSFQRSYFSAMKVPIVTARGGNVIGGGDFSVDRIIPDIVRALIDGKEPQIRNPNATRPWQHVLDCLDGYFAFAEALAKGNELPLALNFGPSASSEAIKVGHLANIFMTRMGRKSAAYKQVAQGPHEPMDLSIDSSLSMRNLQWKPKMDSHAAIELTALWYDGFIAGERMSDFTDSQIKAFEELS